MRPGRVLSMSRHYQQRALLASLRHGFVYSRAQASGRPLMRRLFLLVLVLAVCPLAAASARTIVHAGRLIDGIGRTARDHVSIIIEGDRIVDVVAGAERPGDKDEVIDLSGHTVMPGLMDMHVHLTDELTRTAYIEEFTLNPPDLAFRAAANARKTLLAGFTTVRNVGDDGMT